jgi:hypothetical protein
MAENIKTKKSKTLATVAKKVPVRKKNQKTESAVKKGPVIKKTEVVVKKDRATAKSKKASVKKAVKAVPVLKGKDKQKVESKTESRREEYFLRWKGPDFVRTIGEEYLYWASLVLSGLIVIWSLWQMNFFTALSFMILIVVVVFELKSQPKEVEYEVNLEGVMIDGRLLRFNEMRSFDIFEKAGFNIVRLQMKTAIFPIKEVFLEESQDLVYVKTLFEYFLPEEKQEDKLFNFKEKKELTEDEYLDKVVDDYIKGKF